ncbi:cyclin-dependent protein kinase inhibitor SMR4-like [Mercurialis annua]|uniref:cyclin-dependent protein kinase inhibitor SMR4-like n=1 Tax=Mercurialis annua TaxID=3986 RepID=UPI0024AC9279|nr:cyclin-dependent protein kinase inhibitor SMR4-like [Mercurialis annua]
MKREDFEDMSTVVAEEEEESDNDGCATPIRGEFKIPEPKVCPPPPRKNKFVIGKKREPPKNGYFEPPELELLFTVNSRRQACV